MYSVLLRNTGTFNHPPPSSNKQSYSYTTTCYYQLTTSQTPNRKPVFHQLGKVVYELHNVAGTIGIRTWDLSLDRRVSNNWTTIPALNKMIIVCIRMGRPTYICMARPAIFSRVPYYFSSVFSLLRAFKFYKINHISFIE